jgi:hypothetical protein
MKAFALLAAICTMAQLHANEPLVRETVLVPGESIEATNKAGTVKISYISPTERKYEWDGKTRIVNLTPRPERFLGMLGIYDPADTWGPVFRVRLVLQEAIRDFETEDQAYAFLKEGSAVMYWCYTNDGLVVGFGRTPERQQINIDLWQILIRGKKPTSLRGATPEHIKRFTN